MENGNVSAMNSSVAVECNDSSTSDCVGYVDDEALYDYYASLILLMTGLPHTFKTILIVLYDSFRRDVLVVIIIVVVVRTTLVLIVLYTLTMVLSVIGNALAIAAFVVSRGHAHSDLRWYLVNLAAADLVMAAFCMPFTFTMTMLGHWVFSAPMCPVTTLGLTGC